MITVGIISEYNPFHKGHMRQIEAIRRSFDTDVTVISLMSGNFVQRGEFAILPKGYRAKAAILSGADLVLEYPYPWSGACAEIFAAGGVAILSALGVNYLCFGSESGELSSLTLQAERLSSNAFESTFSEAIKKNPATAYAVIRDSVYEKLYGESLARRANDILGVQYLLALKKQNSKMKPLVIKREGFESATASRAAYRDENYDELKNLATQYSLEIMAEQKAVRMQKLEEGILLFLRLARADAFDGIMELTDDLRRRMLSAAQKVKTLDEFFEAVASKSYTNARVRRVLLSMLFSVDRATVHSMPAFTRLLGAREKGRAFLEGATFPILKRAGDGATYGEAVAKQVAFADRADCIYQSADENLPLHKPFIL